MGSLSCPKCSGAKKEWATVCWKCYTSAQISAARDQGYSQGYLAGIRAGKQQATMNVPTISEARWRQLVQLAHPDKHNNSKTAKEVMQWLNDIRP